jgi:transcriptional regulator NrdR family protein
MVCIYCAGQTRVTNSRPQKRLQQVWRRHLCTKCGALFTSIEAADLSTGLIVRRIDGSVAPFSRDTLFLSVLQAVGHRAASIDDAGAVTATIIATLIKSAHTASLSPADIATAALRTLKHFDSAAATLYQAYHPNKKAA